MVRETPAAYRITDLSADERPRERLEKSCPEALSKSELLAILLRVGVTWLNSVQHVQKILNVLGGLA